MDEISRELPPDTTDEGQPRRGARDARKGPGEWVAHERSTIAEDLVVENRAVSDVPRLPSRGPADASADQSAEEPDGEIARPGLDAEPRTEAAESERQAAIPAATALPATGGADDTVDLDAARAAVADEAGAVEIEEEYEPEDDDGLPPVPELQDAAEVARVVFVLMLTSREGLSMLRLAQACNTSQKLVEQALGLLQDQLRTAGMPVELARTGDTVKWLSAPATFPYLQRLRGVKKLEKLSPAALETLAVIAYRQPVMRGEIEAIRGVKAGPMLRTLLQHKLVKVTGRADVPGRPLQYGTTPQFLERFGIGSLQELPSVKEWKNLG